MLIGVIIAVIVGIVFVAIWAGQSATRRGSSDQSGGYIPGVTDSVGHEHHHSPGCGHDGGSSDGGGDSGGGDGGGGSD